MANKNRKAQMQQANQAKAKQKQYDAATKNLFIFPCIALGLSVLLLLLFFVTFSDVYNTETKSLEFKVNGWTYFAAGLVGNYSSVEWAGGFLAVPFYKFAEEWVEAVGTLTVITVFVALFNLIIQLVTVLKKFNGLNVVSAVMSLATSILLIVVMAKTIDMNNAKIISDYCGNPACEVRSCAIFPAIVAFGSCAVSGYAMVKNIQARYLLK